MATSKYAGWSQEKLAEFAAVQVEAAFESIVSMDSIALRKVFDGELHLMILSPQDFETVGVAYANYRKKWAAPGA